MTIQIEVAKYGVGVLFPHGVTKIYILGPGRNIYTRPNYPSIILKKSVHSPETFLPKV